MYGTLDPKGLQRGMWKEILAKQYRDKPKATLLLLSFICSWMYMEQHHCCKTLYTYPPVKFYVN